MTPRRILIVSYAYPPMPTGGNRWLAMAKYLRRAGHDVTILTTSAFGCLEASDEVGVVRVDDLMAAPWLRGLFRRPPLPVAGEPAALDKPVPGIITKVIVPDFHLVTWVPFAARTARGLHRIRAFDCLITTSAFESIHLVALAFGRSRPPWIADFRDGWTFHSWREPFPTQAQVRLDSLLERRVARSAERVVTVERPVRDDFRERLGVDAVHVPNGWDPELEAELRESEVPELGADGRVVLVHTGRMIGSWGRSPRPLLEGLARLRAQYPELAERIVLVLAGRQDRQELEMLDAYKLDGLVRHIGQLSRGGSLALQRRADVLVLITAPNLVWELPGKLFEYMAAGRPILALARGNEAAHVVEETGTGVTVSPEDSDELVAALARAARGELAAGSRSRALEPYTYPAPARAMEVEIERAVSLLRRNPVSLRGARVVL
jgi:glycosyltransferase involved in cell wall biosynthesis